MRIVRLAACRLGVEEEARMRGQSTLAEVADLLDVAHLLEVSLERHAQETAGLTLSQAILLCRVELKGGRATVSELADLVQRSGHTVSARLNVLARRGLIARTKRSSDRREVVVTLTAKGAARLAACRKDLRSALDEILNAESGLPDLSGLKRRLQETSWV